MTFSDKHTPPHSEVIGVKEWLFTGLVSVIPVLNLVMALVWSFGRHTNPSKANYAKAMLMFWLLWLIIAAAAAWAVRQAA